MTAREALRALARRNIPRGNLATDILPIGMPVSVFWNIPRACFSVRDASGKVACHASHVTLRNARFTVQQAARAKVIATGKKTVHAFVRGYLLPDEACQGLTERVRYNPRECATFQFADTGAPIHNAERCALQTRVGSKPAIFVPRAPFMRLAGYPAHWRSAR